MNHSGYDAPQSLAGQQFTHKVTTGNMNAQRAMPPYTDRTATNLY